MITLLTGLPGHGKTLYALWMIEKKAREENRAVYYWNIKGLTLPWFAMGDASTFAKKGVEPDRTIAKKWYELPAGSIIVFDEVQKLMPPRSQGSLVPKYIEELQTHRHLGHDIFCITQHPKLIDTALRELVGDHYHLARRFKLDSSVVYKWEELHDPKSTADKKDAQSSRWKHPKHVYSWYVSAEEHNVKAELPWKKFAVVAALMTLVVVSLVFGYRRVSSVGDGMLEGQKTSSESRSPDSTGQFASFATDPWSTKYREPRIAGVPASAPMYDAKFVVQSVPRVEGCMSLKYGDGTLDCRCFTQQATRIEMSVSQCMNHMRNPGFDATRPDIDLKAIQRARLDSLSHGQTSDIKPAGGGVVADRAF